MIFKRSQVNIDFIVSALIFFGFLVAIFSMTMDLTTPFLTTVSQDIDKKHQNILSSEIPKTFSSLESLCSKKVPGFEDVWFSYSVSLIPLPGWDTRTQKGNLSIQRRDYEITLNASGSFNLTLKFPESLDSISKDVNATRDYYGNWVYELQLESETVRMKAKGQNYFMVSSPEKGWYLGSIPLQDACKEKGEGTPSYYESTSVFKSKEGRIPVTLEVRAYE